MHGASTPWSLPSRATLPSRQQTHLSALCLLHDRGNVQTLSGAYSCLYSHRFGMPTCRDLVHTRTPQGYWEGIHSRLRTRSVAFPDHSQRALQRLREHMAQDQGRGQWVAKWCGQQSPETLTTLGRLQRQRGDRIGPGKDREKSRTVYVGKMMLNSVWGKFGQRTNKTQVWEFDDPKKFSTFCISDTLQIKYVGIQSDDRVEVQYTLQEEDESISPNLNMFVACFMTCWARLKLYDALDILQKRVLYKDMDSVVFLSA